MYHIVQELGAATGLAEDAVVNTFSFKSGVVVSDATLTDLILAVRDFYNAVPTGQSYAIKDSLSLHLSRAGDAGSTRAYWVPIENLDGSPHGSPQLELPFTLASRAAGEATMPSEVALAVTLEGLNRETTPVEGPGDVRPRSRRTGKLFLGPFTVAALTSETAARVPQALIDRVNAACGDLADASQALGMDWCVWSRAAEDVFTVTHVSIDNAWDTQRRRGLKATARTRVTV